MISADNAAEVTVRLTSLSACTYLQSCSSSKEMNYKGVILSFQVEIFTIIAKKVVQFHNVLYTAYVHICSKYVVYGRRNV